MTDTMPAVEQKIKALAAEMVDAQIALWKEAISEHREAVDAIAQYSRELGVETELRVKGRMLHLKSLRDNSLCVLPPEEVYHPRDHLQKKVEARRAASVKLGQASDEEN